MKTIVKVRRKHILAGVCGDAETCAVALALQDIGAKAVQVSGCLAFIFGGRAYMIVTPDKVRNFIDEFDDVVTVSQRKTLKPISFKLDLDKGGV